MNGILFEVDVLLATYNGEEYLNDFLVSLSNQKGVAINLIVSDDGSSDKTLEILRNSQKLFKNIEFFFGPSTGPSDNFFSLLEKSKSDFIAFADQDDVWEPFHLFNSIEFLHADLLQPQLTYSALLEFQETNGELVLWPKHYSLPGFNLFIFQNFARGCTIVFNRSLLNLILERFDHEFAIMHDWWFVLVAYSCGKVHYSPRPQIQYRVHENNFVGVTRPNLYRRFALLRNQPWKPMQQITAIRENFGDFIHSECLNVMDMVILGIQGNFANRLRFISKFRMRLRDNIFDEIKLRLFILVYPYVCSKRVIS